MKPIDLQHSNAADPVAAEVTRLVCDAVPSTSLLTSAATSIRVNGRPWRQTALLTLGAVALFIGIRRLPTGTKLSHMDFRAQGKNVIEFCDPLNPQFLPVVAVRSPVTMSVATETEPVARQTIRATLTLVTSTGKPVGPADLLVSHTQKLHLLIVDPTLTDYQHVHPVPGRRPGEWTFEFAPRLGGLYRLFADFTPAATGRGLYASTDLAVADVGSETVGPVVDRAARPTVGPTTKGLAVSGIVGPVVDRAARPTVGPTTEGLVGSEIVGQVGDLADRSARPTVGPSAEVDPKSADATTVVVDGYRFTLAPATPLRANQPVDLALVVTRSDGGRVPLEPIMGAFAHLVAFDESRSGFAHLHPNETDLARPPDAVAPRLTFKVTIPRAGRYAVWAQVKLGDREVFAPFWVDVDHD